MKQMKLAGCVIALLTLVPASASASFVLIDCFPLVGLGGAAAATGAFVVASAPALLASDNEIRAGAGFGGDTWGPALAFTGRSHGWFSKHIGYGAFLSTRDTAATSPPTST